ncbi:MAG TPA: SRPBCC family protein [Bryobacteraceae bacterium]|nr:SRPBCC family protein [Bryobacteraceae bacterium]
MSAPPGIRETFAAFESPYNLARITPPWLNFRVTTPGRIAMRAGAEIDYAIRRLGLPIKWTTRIVEYEPPRRFVDEQIRGPYRLWRHRHTFRESAAGTVISDCVDYRLPFGILGAAAHALLIRRQLIAIFRFRQQAIARLLLPENPGAAVIGEPMVRRVSSKTTVFPA